ncbi:GNAT family N-acetyltransferase [Paracoccus fistulariae]|uniref:GNAT family N-acetyltransferase n=1 Tax=Paracoccus fistulariae TaxID=658446 RepID=A0ABY7SM52_9RHOB|nr:GNAT family N-acetyltransferase [Paracoccus fistulariae]MDB6179850.1 GNAT family N-acetyltransferase [Paracoccus fistulariae]WCR07954.1 GNAT family N-acetyltransferase [Paracoccus fistulariae]
MSDSVLIRDGRRDDVAAVIALLADDMLGRNREGDDLQTYLHAFDQMQAEGNSHLVVAEAAGRVVGCYQITYISGLSRRAARRAQIEGVRVATDLRGQNLGAALIADAETRARDAGCSLLQFTTGKERKDAHRFYDRLGFTPSHIGYKKTL